MIISFQIQTVDTLAVHVLKPMVLPLCTTTMFGTRLAFFCEAQGCTHRAPFQTKGALSNHQRSCKALREEEERDFQRWKKQKVLDAKAREAERLRSMEATPPTTSTDLNVIVRSIIHPYYISPD